MTRLKRIVIEFPGDGESSRLSSADVKTRSEDAETTGDRCVGQQLVRGFTAHEDVKAADDAEITQSAEGGSPSRHHNQPMTVWQWILATLFLAGMIAGGTGYRQNFARGSGYKWLARQMGLTRDQCHIGMFDVEQCKLVVEICSPPYGRKDAA